MNTSKIQLVFKETNKIKKILEQNKLPGLY